MRRAGSRQPGDGDNRTEVLPFKSAVDPNGNYDPNPVSLSLKTWEKTDFENEVGKTRWDFAPSQTPGANDRGIPPENHPPIQSPGSRCAKARNESRSALFSRRSTTGKRL